MGDLEQYHEFKRLRALGEARPRCPLNNKYSVYSSFLLALAFLPSLLFHMAGVSLKYRRYLRYQWGLSIGRLIRQRVLHRASTYLQGHASDSIQYSPCEMRRHHQRLRIINLDESRILSLPHAPNKIKSVSHHLLVGLRLSAQRIRGPVVHSVHFLTSTRSSTAKSGEPRASKSAREWHADDTR